MDRSRLVAIASMLTATLFIATSLLMAKLVGSGWGAPDGQGLNPLQITAGRFLFGFLGIACFVVVRRPKLQRPAWRWHLLRSLLGMSGVGLMFTAALLIPLAETTAITFLNPIFAMIFAVIILREQVGWIRWSCAALAFAGALVLVLKAGFVLRPEALVALAAAALLGGEVIALKFLSGREPLPQILLLNNLIALLVMGSLASFVWVWPSGQQWLGLAGVGLAMVSAQVFFTAALRLTEASFIAPFSYATLLVSGGLDWVVFGSLPSLQAWAGVAIIMTAGLMLSWREAVRDRRGKQGCQPGMSTSPE